MRQGIRRLAQRLLWASGVSFVASRLLPEDARFAIELHGVAEREFVELPEELRPSMTADSLRALLAWLDRRFRFLSPEEFLESNRPGVMMTFDDGFANHVEVALPILEEFSAPAVFFVPSRHVDHPDDWLPSERARLSRCGLKPEDLPQGLGHEVFDGLGREGLRVCAEHPLITVGSHTVDHPRLVELRDDELRQQLMQSKKVLESALQSPVDLLSYPFGDYDGRVAAAAEAAGYTAGFVEEARHLTRARFEISRVGIYSAASPYLAAKFSGLFARPLRGPLAS